MCHFSHLDLAIASNFVAQGLFRIGSAALLQSGCTSPALTPTRVRAHRLLHIVCAATYELSAPYRAGKMGFYALKFAVMCLLGLLMTPALFFGTGARMCREGGLGSTFKSVLTSSMVQMQVHHKLVHPGKDVRQNISAAHLPLKAAHASAFCPLLLLEVHAASSFLEMGGARSMCLVACHRSHQFH